MSTVRPVVGVSSCLLGQAVRYDGGDKRESFVADVLPRYVQLIPICPEVGIGMGVPRPPIRLEGQSGAVHAVGVADKTLDVTEQLRAYGRAAASLHPTLSGYVFKSKSPSCGLHQVKRFTGGQELRDGRGLYADEIMRAFPQLPAIEEGELATSDGQENFLTTVFSYHRWHEAQRQGLTVERLGNFHAAHKMILLARSREHLDRLGRLVANGLPLPELAQRYGELFLEALTCPATRQRHADVLQHLSGYLKERLDPVDKAELLDRIERYRTGSLSLAAPLKLLQYYFKQYPHPYIDKQLYLTQAFLF